LQQCRQPWVTALTHRPRSQPLSKRTPRKLEGRRMKQFCALSPPEFRPTLADRAPLWSSAVCIPAVHLRAEVKSFPVCNPNHLNFYLLTGKQRSKGVELETTFQLHRT
jgi:hypothetical protein